MRLRVLVAAIDGSFLEVRKFTVEHDILPFLLGKRVRF